MVTEVVSTAQRRVNYNAKTDAAVAIPAAGNTTILEMDTSQISRLGMEIINAGAQAFDAFIVQGKFHPDGAYVTLLSVTADYITPTGIVVDASGDLTVLASGATGWLIIDVLSLTKVRVQASANVAGATSASVLAAGS